MNDREGAELNSVFPPADARNAILEAALSVFADAGFHGATTRNIAQAAGVSQPLLHHHFGGKGALWRLVGERTASDFLTHMFETVDLTLPPEAGVRAMLRAYLDYWRTHPKAFRFSFWRLQDGPAAERLARADAVTQHGVLFIQRAQAAGYIRPDIPPGLVLMTCGGAIQFWLRSQLEVREALAITGDQDLNDDAFLDHLLSLMRVRGVPR